MKLLGVSVGEGLKFVSAGDGVGDGGDGLAQPDQTARIRQPVAR